MSFSSTEDSREEPDEKQGNPAGQPGEQPPRSQPGEAIAGPPAHMQARNSPWRGASHPFDQPISPSSEDAAMLEATILDDTEPTAQPRNADSEARAGVKYYFEALIIGIIIAVSCLAAAFHIFG